MKSSFSHPRFMPLSGLCGFHVWQWGQSFRVALIAELSTVVRIRVANSFDHHQIPIQGLIMLLFFYTRDEACKDDGNADYDNWVTQVC